MARISVGLRPADQKLELRIPEVLHIDTAIHDLVYIVPGPWI